MKSNTMIDQVSEYAVVITETFGQTQPGVGYLGGQTFEEDVELDHEYRMTLNEAFNIIRDDLFIRLAEDERQRYSNQPSNIPIVDLYAYCTWKMQHEEPAPHCRASTAVMRIMVL